jgi:CRP-like cAMP-binding protein
MKHDLIHHLEKFIPVSEDLRARVDQISMPLNLVKGTYLHKPNRICDTTYFINSGLVRVYYRKGEKEITDNFAGDGEWITSIYSFLKNVPDSCYIQTLTASRLTGISIQQLEKCFADFPEMERFGRILMSTYFLEQSERIISHRFHSAKERYDFFLRTSKNKMKHIPLGMLASYLGMTQETLSRIRATK